MDRLQKVMAHAGIASRRKCEEIIAEGRVAVNGEIVTEMGVKVDPEEDKVVVDGKIISKEKKIYILLNKPEGYITTVSDPEDRDTVIDLMPDIKQRLYPVGRLDFNSSGLIILTNDGNLTYKLTHPKKEVDKTYEVEVRGLIDSDEFNKFKEGIIIDGRKTSPAETSNIRYYNDDNKTKFEITIHEGRNRQVRRMCEIIGYPVRKLKRTGLAFLKIDDLKKGEYRYLTDEEVKKLKKLG